MMKHIVHFMITIFIVDFVILTVGAPLSVKWFNLLNKYTKTRKQQEIVYFAGGLLIAIIFYVFVYIVTGKIFGL